MLLTDWAKNALFHESDTPELKAQIKELVRRKYPVSRKTQYHIKIHDVNYYPTRGKITIDPSELHKQRGFGALLELLESRYPRSKAIDLSFEFAD